jgi:aminomethyltransferase
MQKTILHDEHLKLKAKMVEFGGWHMPVSYTTVLAEHKNVREDCGVFDVSHMGEVFVTGRDATAYLKAVAMNDVGKLSIGGGQYTGILNEKGGFVDDLIVYRIDQDAYLICTNASNTDKDYEWLKKNIGTFQVYVENRSSQYGQLAIQGPKSLEMCEKVFSKSTYQDISKLSYTGICETDFNGEKIFVARTGYTGEKGFEVYLKNELVEKLWTTLMKNGCHPIGLGARDTLRLEACYLLYGNDMNESVTPLEAGVAWAVGIERGPFIGRDALLRQKESGIPRTLRAFRMNEDGVARHGMEVRDLNGNPIGHVTSGSVLATVGGAGGMCLIQSAAAKLGSQVQIDVRGKTKLATLVKRPLYEARTK